MFSLHSSFSASTNVMFFLFPVYLVTDDGALYDTETFMLVFIVNKSWILKLCCLSLNFNSRKIVFTFNSIDEPFNFLHEPVFNINIRVLLWMKSKYGVLQIHQVK